MNWHLGTMGFSYDDWLENFYPAKTSASDYLAFYSKHFDTVELDTTSYAAPPVERVKKWHDMTPEKFWFSAKAPRSITHELPAPEAVDELLRFVDAMRAMEQKLGVLILQFAPSFEINQFAKLEALLIAAPKDLRFAVELRDRSWGQQRTLDLLSHHHVALVAAEYTNPPAVIPVTAPFHYVRWKGEHDSFDTYTREQVDRGNRLAWWKEKLLATNDRVTEVWGYFGNDYAGNAIESCERFKRLIGEPVAARQVQKGLFD